MYKTAQERDQALATFHDLPPHCRPRGNSEQCLVGTLRGKCRKCGEMAWVNTVCRVVEAPWIPEQWDANWDQYGNGHGYR